MDANESLLEEFDEPDIKPRKKYFLLVSGIYILQNIVSIALYWLTMISISSRQTFAGQMSVFANLLLFKSLSLIALFLFLFAKRWGWILSVVLLINECLQKAYLIISFALHPHGYLSYFQSDKTILVVLFFISFLSCLMVYFLLSKRMRLLFEISSHTMLWSASVGIAIFVVNLSSSLGWFR